MIHDFQISSCHDQQSNHPLDDCSKAQVVKPALSFFDTTGPPLSAGSSHDGHNNVVKKKPYRCEYCEKSFSKPSALQPHIYTHTGEKPFQCHIPGCNKRFAVISNLRRHFKVHAPKNVARTRMSYKERILRVRQLASMAQLDQELSSSNLNARTSLDVPQPDVVQNVDTAWKLCNEIPNYSFESNTFIDSQILTATLEQPRAALSTISSYTDCTNVTDMYLTFDSPSMYIDVDLAPGWVRC